MVASIVDLLEVELSLIEVSVVCSAELGLVQVSEIKLDILNALIYFYLWLIFNFFFLILKLELILAHLLHFFFMLLEILFQFLIIDIRQLIFNFHFFRTHLGHKVFNLKIRRVGRLLRISHRDHHGKLMKLIQDERRNLVKFLTKLSIALTDIIAKLLLLTNRADLVQQDGIDSFDADIPAVVPSETFIKLVIVEFLHVADRVEITVVAVETNCLPEAFEFAFVVVHVAVHGDPVGFLDWVQEIFGDVRGEHQDADLCGFQLLGLELDRIAKAEQSISDVIRVLHFDIGIEQILNPFIIGIPNRMITLIDNKTNIINTPSLNKFHTGLKDKPLQAPNIILVHGRSNLKNKHHESLHHEEPL